MKQDYNIFSPKADISHVNILCFFREKFLFYVVLPFLCALITSYRRNSPKNVTWNDVLTTVCLFFWEKWRDDTEWQAFFIYWMLWVLNNARWFSCKVMTTYERISIALLIPANVLYSLALFSHSWFQLPDVSYGLWVAKYCDYLSCQIIPAFFTEEPGKRSLMRID